MAEKMHHRRYITVDIASLCRHCDDVGADICAFLTRAVSRSRLKTDVSRLKLLMDDDDAWYSTMKGVAAGLYLTTACPDPATSPPCTDGLQCT